MGDQEGAEAEVDSMIEAREGSDAMVLVAVVVEDSMTVKEGSEEAAEAQVDSDQAVTDTEGHRQGQEATSDVITSVVVTATARVVAREDPTTVQEVLKAADSKLFLLFTYNKFKSFRFPLI